MKKILVLFLLLFAVQVQAAGIYTTVARGTVTQANMKISAVDGTAFVDFSAADVLTSKIGHLLKIRDSSGRAIQGFIRAAGTGETYNDVMSGWDFTSGWSTAVASIIDANSFSTASGSGGVYKSNITTAGYLYKITYERTTTAGGSTLRFSGAGLVTSPGFIPVSTGVYYYQSITGFPSIYLSHETSAGQTDVISMKVEAVLTPSATGVTIVNTKGGSTFNFALKNSSFNYSDSSGYTYEIIQVRQLPAIAGGAVTAANERLSLVDGTAFYFGSIDCRAGGYHDGRHWARFQDSSGRVAFAKIKAEEPAGEALGSETNSTANASSDPNSNEANATTTWLSDGATITSDGSVKTTGSYSIKADFSTGGTYVVTASGFTPIVGALYKIVADLKTENNARVITVDGTGTIIRTVLAATSDWVAKTEYITNKAGTMAYLGYYGGKAFAGQQGIVYIDNYSRKQVTVPPATGALLENMAGTRNMIYAHPSFNPNAIANIQILYVGD